MNDKLERYLEVDPDAFYRYNERKIAQSVHVKSSLRYEKAKEQAQLPIVDKTKIIKIITQFLNEIGIKTAEDPIMNPKSINYSKIKEEYSLKNSRDLVWIKFTKDGYVGVVATSNDINFDIPKSDRDYDKTHKVFNTYTSTYEYTWVHNTSGILVHKLGKAWDESFVLVFPLKNIPSGYHRGDIEKAVGNLLIEKGIPILDYYSHLY